jgi:hypothetical protein
MNDLRTKLECFHLELRKDPGWALKALDQNSGWPKECAMKAGLLPSNGTLLYEGHSRGGSNSGRGSVSKDDESEDSESSCTWEDILE